MMLRSRALRDTAMRVPHRLVLIRGEMLVCRIFAFALRSSQPFRRIVEASSRA